MIIITRVTDKGNDIIEVQGYDKDFPEDLLVATGWLSALNNHYDEAAYGEDGHLKEKSEPRKMTEKEQNQYFVKLLNEKKDSKVIFEDQKAIDDHESAISEKLSPNEGQNQPDIED